MDKSDSNNKNKVEDEKLRSATESTIDYLQTTMHNGTEELNRLRIKLSLSYWIIIVLSVIMFFVGIALLLIPAMAAFSEINTLQSLIAGGFGVADLTGLFLFRPIEKIKNMMGDMSQIILIISSYQTQAGLRLMQMDVNNRPSLGQAADNINKVTYESIRMIQKYFEIKEDMPKQSVPAPVDTEAASKN
ncbi:MAG: hypothetical protein PHY99_08290 [Bacteroidales bacterium]|nr:hypothetical protein [Bacteroidales bacterium]